MNLKPTLILQLLFGISLSYTIAFSFSLNSFAQENLDTTTQGNTPPETTTQTNTGTTPPETTTQTNTGTTPPETTTQTNTGTTPPESTTSNGSGEQPPSSGTTTSNGSSEQPPSSGTTTSNGSGEQAPNSDTGNNPQPQQTTTSTNTIITGSCNKNDCSACQNISFGGIPLKKLCCITSIKLNTNAIGCPVPQPQ